MLYEFSQNSSGGFFEKNDYIAETVIIEANSYEEAEEIALDIGIYFDGVEKELDCECCGDRWSEGIEMSYEEFLDYIAEYGCEYTKIYTKSGKIF